MANSYLNTVVCFTACIQRQMSCLTRTIVSQSPYSSHSFNFSSVFPKLKRNHIYLGNKKSCSYVVDSCWSLFGSKKRNNYTSLAVKNSVNGRKSCLDFSLQCKNTTTNALLPKQGIVTKVERNVGSLSRPCGRAFTGLLFGLLVCYSTYKPTQVAIAQLEDSKMDSSSNSSHGKKVCNDYSITGIPGDGRCLFRSIAHGACLRSVKVAPNESLQRELADDLRARVADEFVRRREETEWFIEGDFDKYVSQIRKPHVWGGEPELLMASHVLRMPITVYMYDKNCGGLISIAEYGEEYGKDNPIRVLYNGFGHYDALQIPGNKGAQSRL